MPLSMQVTSTPSIASTRVAGRQQRAAASSRRCRGSRAGSARPCRARRRCARRRRRSTSPPGVATVRDRDAAGVDHVDPHAGRRRRAAATRPALDRERPDAGEDVAAVLRCRSTLGLVDDDLQEQIVDVGVRSRVERDDDGDLAGQRIGAADAVDLARVGRAHDREQDAVARRGVGRQVARRGSRAPFDVPPRITVHGIARLHGSSHRHSPRQADTYAGPSPRACRACRRCRGRARPPASAARVFVLLRLARLRGFEHRRDASRAARRTTPSSSATITSPGLTSAPAQTTGTLTEPSVSLTVPCAETAFDQTGKAHLRQVAHVAHAGIDDQPAHAARRERGGEQLAEIAVVARRGRRDDQHVAGPALLDRDMDHPVVAGRHRAR